MTDSKRNMKGLLAVLALAVMSAVLVFGANANKVTADAAEPHATLAVTSTGNGTVYIYDTNNANGSPVETVSSPGSTTRQFSNGEEWFTVKAEAQPGYYVKSFKLTEPDFVNMTGESVTKELMTPGSYMSTKIATKGGYEVEGHGTIPLPGEFAVSVEFAKKPTYKVTIIEEKNGNLTTSYSDEISVGGTWRYNFAPIIDDVTEIKLDDVVVNKDSLTGEDKQLVITNMTSNHTLHYKLKDNIPPVVQEIPVTVRKYMNGDSKPYYSKLSHVNKKQQFTTNLNLGSNVTLQKVLVNGSLDITNMVSNGYLSIWMTDENIANGKCDIGVYVKSNTTPTPTPKTFKFTYSYEGIASMTGLPGNGGKMTEGKTYTITFKPHDGYTLDYIKVNGQNVSPVGSSVVLSNVKSDIHLEIKASKKSGGNGGNNGGNSGGNGSGTSGGNNGGSSGGNHGGTSVKNFTISTQIKSGAGSYSGTYRTYTGMTAKIVFTPAKGYYVQKVLVNGQQRSISNNTLMISNVQRDYNVQVYFAKTSDKSKVNAITKTKIKLKVKKSKKVAKLSWTKVKGAKGYKVYRAVKKNGKYKLFKTVKKNVLKVKVTKKNKQFYKVMAYGKVSGTNYSGKWSNVKRIK